MDSVLIERFFNKQCTPAEATKVALYLKHNPSILEKYLSKDEWESLPDNENLSKEFWDELWIDINKKNKAHVFRIKLKRFAAAASIIFVIASVYFLWQPSRPAAAITTIANTTLPAFKNLTVSNTTKKIMHIELQDSSVVLLAPASAISYTVPFQHNKREIMLEGEAEFHVAKNKHKPFTVYAGALATTALGTIFSVKKNDKKNSITVKLFRGKVIVQSIDKNLKGWNKDVYLLPGDEMKFSIATALLTVNKANALPNQNIDIKLKSKQADVDSSNDKLVFNNTKLSSVINKLSVLYKVPIQYDSLLIDTMNFTGTVSKNDSLPVILKVIGEMNELDIFKNEDGFIISKHQ